MKCSISPGDVHDHPTHRHLSPDSTSRRLFFGDFSHNGSPLFSLKEYFITITLSSRKMSLSEISWFVDITTLNFRPNRGIESGAHWPLFFTSIKEDSDTQVRSNCSVAEVIHNLLCFSKICHWFVKILQPSVHCVRRERSTPTTTGRSSENVNTISSYSRHF